MRWVRIVMTLLFGLPILVVAALCAGAAVAAQFGRRSDEWDVLAHFAPIWLVGALIAFALAWMFGGYMRALILGMSAVGIAAALALILPELMRDAGPRASADAPHQLKVVQANIWDQNRNLAGSIDWIAAQKPDIVIMEETTPAIRELVVARTGWRIACDSCQVMIFSPMTPVTAGAPKHGEPSPPMTAATFRWPGGDFTVIGTHYVWPTRDGRQQAEGRALIEVLGRFDKDRMILAGDFNSTPWSFSRRREDAAFGLIRRTRALFSWPAGPMGTHRLHAPLPFLPIDHVYAGPGWATVKVERGPRLGSDHYPVIVTLAPVAPR